MNRKQRRAQQSQAKQQKTFTCQGITYTADGAFNKATELEQQHKDVEAASLYRAILEQVPDHVQSMNNLGLLFYNKADAVSDAIQLYRKAIQLRPDYAIAHHNLGDALMSEGKMEEAEHMYRKAIALKPDFAKACYSLTHMIKYTSMDHPDIRHILKLLDSTIKEDREYLGFSMGKICDDCGLYDEAFRWYREANSICKASISCDREAIARDTDVLTRIFTPELFKRCASIGTSDKTPLFIVGMPRSGTTLLANILSNHPAVEAAGELPTMIDGSLKLPELLGIPTPYPEAVQYIIPDAAQILAQRYLERLRRDFATASVSYIIDKHPINFSRLGLIALLFPEARIIHCTRNPMDTCLSNYFQNFSRDYFYSFDLQDIGHFYAGYAKLMAHWQKVLPRPFLEIGYEDIVTNTEPTVRRAIEFLGLSWDKRCLTPHTNPRIVKTASVWQVRQPVYTRSAQRWRHYEKHLGPFKEVLASLHVGDF